MYGNSEVLVQCKDCHSYNDATPPRLHVNTDLLPYFKNLLSHATQAYNDMAAQYRHLSPEDPRKSVGYHLLSVASSGFLSLAHVRDNLQHDDWWQKHGYGTALEAGIVRDLIENYITLTAGSLIFFSFSLFESGIRRVVRALDRTACDGGAAEFKSIYDWLFKRLRESGWTYHDGDPVEFMDLFRTFRNTLHNNGAFYNRYGRDETRGWKGIEYRFVYGSVPDFYGWEFNLSLLSELINLNRSIMTSELVAKLPRNPSTTMP